MARRSVVSVLAILVIIVAAITMTGRSSRAEPASGTCLGKPDGTAPEGSHWYHRVDRVTHRRCWYVRPNGLKGRHAALPKRFPVAISAPRLSAAQSRPVRIATEVADEPDVAEETDVKEPAPKQSAVQEPNVAPGEATSVTPPDWPDRPKPALAVPFLPTIALLPTATLQLAVMSDSRAEEVRSADEADDVHLVWPLLTIAEVQTAEPAAAFRFDMKYVLPLVLCGLAFAVLFGCVFAEFFGDRRQRRARKSVQSSLDAIRLVPGSAALR